jgi:outer membrane protein assembly factor BamB
VRLRAVIVTAALIGSIFSIFGPSVISDESNESVWVMIDFGNGKVHWAEVGLTDNTTAILATEKACEKLSLDVIVIWGIWGGFVSEIAGVSPSDWSWWWGFFIWNQTTDSWEDSQVGASLVELEDGDVIGWSPVWDYLDPVQPTPTPSAKYPWTMFQHDSLNSGSSEEQGPISNSISWIFSTETIELAASSAVVDNNVVINNWGGVFCLDMQGEIIWNNQDVVGGFSPAISQNSVFVGGKDGYLYCLNLTSGETKWKAKITENPGLSGVTSSPTIDRGNVYVGAFNYSGGPGGLFCLDAKSGSILWERDTPSSVYFSSPAVYKDRVFIGTMGLYSSSTLKWGAPYGFFCYNANDGDLIWNVTAGGSVGSSATILEENVLFTSKDGFLYCMAQSNGEIIWKKDIGSSVSSAAVSEGKIFVGTGEMNGEGNLLCLSSTGNIIWEFRPNGAVQGSPAVAGDLVYFGTNVKNGTVYCLNKDTGQLKWEYRVWPEQYIISSPSIVDDRMYIASDNGRLYCFGGETPSIDVSESEGFQDVNFREDVIFYHNGKENKLNILSANQNRLVLKIGSLSESIEITKGEPYVIDTDGDGERDLKIFVEQVNTTSQTASLSLEIPEKSDMWFIITLLIVIFIIVLIIVIVVIRKRRLK